MPESIVSGSSSSLTPRAGDATQVAKDGQLGSPSDSQPLDFVTRDGGTDIPQGSPTPLLTASTPTTAERSSLDVGSHVGDAAAEEKP